MRPHSHEEHIQHIFDAFCKKVLQNDIDNGELAEAIAALPAQKRDIILLSYFLDMPDSEIARALNMVRSSVAYRRSATLKLLRELMGGKACDFFYN